MPSTVRQSKKKLKSKAVKKPKAKTTAKKLGRRKSVPIVNEPVPKLVCYYLEGWRYGYQEAVKGEVAIIRPIPPIGGVLPRTIRVPVGDVKYAILNKLEGEL